MNSILEELRCMDGELFRSELTQRLYLLLKSQVQDALALSSRTTSQRQVLHAKLLEWPAAVRDEELALLRGKSSEIDSLFVQVAMLYVKLSHKSTENRIVKISRPRLEDLVRSFYQAILHNPWGSSGDMWSFDPIKLDFVLRECFRKAIMDSVQVVQSQAPVPVPVSRRDDDTDIGPDDSISNFLAPESVPSLRSPPSLTRIPEPSASLSRRPDSRDTESTDSDDRRSDSSASHDRPDPNSESEFTSKHSPTSESEFVSSRMQQDDGTVVGRPEDDAGTIRVRSAADDGGTVRMSNAAVGDSGTVVGSRMTSDARTVTFHLPKSAGSVVSSISDSSNGSRFLTAVLHKPTLVPVSEVESSGLRIHFEDEDEDSE